VLTWFDCSAAAAAADSRLLSVAVVWVADKYRFDAGALVCCCSEPAWDSVEQHAGKGRRQSRMLCSTVSTPEAAMPRNLKH
jgi:hypothetical protein